MKTNTRDCDWKPPQPVFGVGQTGLYLTTKNLPLVSRRFWKFRWANSLVAPLWFWTWSIPSSRALLLLRTNFSISQSHVIAICSKTTRFSSYRHPPQRNERDAQHAFSDSAFSVESVSRFSRLFLKVLVELGLDGYGAAPEFSPWDRTFLARAVVASLLVSLTGNT